MKKFILLPLLVALAMPVTAQNWVTIPDANFANKLNELFPECMDGNLMDTTCASIVEETALDISQLDIEDISGIEYFINLSELDCHNNELTSITELPNSLSILECKSNELISLPDLPPTLNELHCNENNLTFLPELPPTLTLLQCSQNQLSSLPELPPQLNFLGCSGASNNLGSLPELPNTLTELVCQHNNLSSLPDLPNNLTSLNCGNNNISALPALPPSLEVLWCHMNNITSLPELPENLERLYFHLNYIVSIPELPVTLEELYCHDNNLASLPELPPQLVRLVCNNNELYCLPTLPNSLEFGSTSWFNISNNPFSCLPNYVPAMVNQNAVWLEYPLCDVTDLENNPYGCIEGITGSVYHDIEGNCVQNSTDSNLVNIPLNLLDSADNIMGTTTTLSSLYYIFEADPGTYTVQLVTENKPYAPPCEDPGDLQEVELSISEPIIQDINFGIECLPNHDIGTQSITTTGWVFPGQAHTLNINAGDMSAWYGLQCADGVSGSVTVDITGPVNYIEPAEGANLPDVTGDIQLTYNIADFAEVDFQNSFGVILETSTTAQTDDLICVEVVVQPIDDDTNPANNTYTHCYTVVNSYNPNIKQVWPHNVEPGYDEYFNYTIYFQNTGTAPAFNIRVADTLDTNLDLSTFEVTGYSHECLTYVEGNVVTFRFNDIMLPDSTSDFDGSIGYVQYRIKPAADLPVGTVIENTAHIFFDFNDAIVTNTTENLFEISTSVAEQTKQSVQVFPNPGTGQFNVLFRGMKNGLTTHLEVYNLSGQRVLQLQVNENRITLDLTDYRSGMYLLHVRNERGSEAIKLMKQ